MSLLDEGGQLGNAGIAESGYSGDGLNESLLGYQVSIATQQLHRWIGRNGDRDLFEGVGVNLHRHDLPAVFQAHGETVAAQSNEEGPFVLILNRLLGLFATQESMYIPSVQFFVSYCVKNYVLCF